MNVGLGVAGLICMGLALGHALTGRALLDRLPRDFPQTRFGDGALTRGVILFTWHALTLMLTTTGAILIALAGGEPVDDRSEVVFLIGALYAAAGLVQAWMSRRRPSDLLRAPVWAAFVFIIVLCYLNL